MATIEIYGAPTVERYYCLYCSFDMTITKVCIDCNEYKSAVTLQEFIEMNGHYPRLRAVK
jgi:hypothetical protein